MSFPEGSFSREFKKQTVGGLVTDLHIYAPHNPLLRAQQRLPSAVLSYFDCEYNFSWTTWWHGGEVQAEIERLGGQTRIAKNDVIGLLGNLNQIDVYYNQYFRNSPPRVSMIDDMPPDEEMLRLFLSTTAGNQNISLKDVRGFIDDFVARRTLMGKTTVGLRRFFLGK